jgi:tetratricopeptide (TPR) repeat protein
MLPALLLQHVIRRFSAAAAVFIVALFCSGAVWAAEPDLQKAELLIKEGKAAEAYALLEPFETQKAGDLLFDYLLASAALLAVQPGYVGVRADMGRAYFALGDFARAKIEFESVLTFQNLPTDLRSAAQQYLTAIEQRQKGQKTVAVGYVEAGIGRDSNIGSATGQSPVTLPDGTQFFLDAPNTRTSARYWQVGAGGEINHQLDDKFSLYAGVDIRGRGIEKFSSSNYSTVDGRAGVTVSSGADLIRLGPVLGRYILDGKGTRDNRGVSADWRHVINNSNQLLLNGIYNQNRYIQSGQEIEDFNLSAVSAGWTVAFLNGTAAATTTFSYGIENAIGGRADGDKRYYGLRLSLQASLSKTLGGFLVLGAQKGNYNEINPSFEVQRADKLVDATIGLSWAFAERWSLRPMFSRTRNKSNVSLNQFERNDVSLTIRRDF